MNKQDQMNRKLTPRTNRIVYPDLLRVFATVAVTCDSGTGVFGYITGCPQAKLCIVSNKSENEVS